jgi:hypothetical protein
MFSPALERILNSWSPDEATENLRPPRRDHWRRTMSIERKWSNPRAIGLLAMLAVGLALGAAVPAAAQTEDVNAIAACSPEEVAPTEGSEWAVPPVQALPGKPF